MKQIRLSESLALPLAVASETVAILGVRGAGKTNTAGVMVEELLDAGYPVVILDPTDSWWGLKASAGGKSPAYPIVVFGGEHADVPLHDAAGAELARYIVESSAPAILSLRHLRKNAQRRFVTEFCEELYHLKGKQEHRKALMVVIDEAPLYIPQKVMGETARTVGAVEDLIARGRSSGFGVVLISQRAATINKDVLTQADTLVVHRLVGPPDIKAVREWFGENVSTAQDDIVKSLPTLQKGDAWVWAPKLDRLERARIRMRRTFDSSASPEMGESARAPKRLAEIDLVALRARMAATVERAKADDPKELRKENAELKRQLAARPEPGPAVVREVPIITDEQMAAIGIFQGRLQEMRDAFERSIIEARVEVFNPVTATLEAILKAVGHKERATPKPAAPIARRTSVAAVHTRDGSTLDGAKQKILDTIAMLGVRGLTPNREMIARWMDIHPNGGRYGSNMAWLREKGYLDGCELTDLGRSVVCDACVTGLEAVRAVVDEATFRIVDVLDQGGTSRSREELAALLGIHPNGGRYGSNLARIRTMGLIPERGEIRLTEAALR